MQSVDEFKPSTTEPVFGSGLISSPTKISQKINDDNEKVIPPSEPLVNGQNDSAVDKITSNGTSENNDAAGDSSTVHVNSESTKEPIEVVKPVEEPPIPSSAPIENKPTELEPVLSTPVKTAPVESSITTAPPPPPPAVEKTVPEVTESEPKGKSTRGKPKPTVVPITPTRQSARGRKTPSASSSSTNVEENQTIKVSSLSSSSQPKDVIPSNDQDITDSPPAGKKRGAITLGKKPAKKTKDKNDIDSVAVASEDEPIQTPPKKARTSANKITPEPPSEEYVRKLRPRK